VKKTIIVFSGDLDRALAAFIIANGAAAMGDEVTMFFTFWGLSVIRRPTGRSTTPRSRLQRLFVRMLPRGPGRLPLSRMQFLGMGPPLMRRAMADRHVPDLDSLIATAREQGVKFVACSMSMDVLGFQPEDLIDGVEVAGVASYLADADTANVNLFV
jgi:peroxiredoxin family protein